MKETLVFLLAPRADARIPPPPPHFGCGATRGCTPRALCAGRISRPAALSLAGAELPERLPRLPGAPEVPDAGPGEAPPAARGKGRGVDPPPRASGQPRGRRHFRRGGRGPRLIPRPARRLRPPPAGLGAAGTGGAAPVSGRHRSGPGPRHWAGRAAAVPSPCGRSARGSSGSISARPPEPAAQPERSSRGAQHLCMCFIGTSVVFDGAQAKRASTSLSSLNIFSRGLACKRVKCSRQSKLTIAGWLFAHKMLNQPWPDSFSHVSREDSVNQHIRASQGRSCVCLMQSGPDSRSPGAGAVSPRAAEAQGRALRGGSGSGWFAFASVLQVFCKAQPSSLKSCDEPVPVLKVRCRCFLTPPGGAQLGAVIDSLYWGCGGLW